MKVGTYVRMYVETYWPITLIVVNFFVCIGQDAGKKKEKGGVGFATENVLKQNKWVVERFELTLIRQSQD